MDALLFKQAPPPYDSLAPAYDLLTADYDHDRWVIRLLDLTATHGLRRGRALDVACGTGSSFVPLLDAGYDVTACDLSPKMVSIATARAGDRAEVTVADMRHLPRWEAFDLVTCLDDAVNHLDSLADVERTLDGIRENLVPGGRLVFDANTLSAYASPPDRVVADARRVVAWHGQAAALGEPGGVCEVRLDLFEDDGDGRWSRRRFSQPHRHHRIADLEALVHKVGMQVLALAGQRPGAVLDDHVDESLHHKAVFVIGRPDA